MTAPFRWVELRAGRAEELVRIAGDVDGDGWALPSDMIDSFGAAVVGAVARIGPVLALAGMTGPPDVVAAGAGRLARAGATLVGVADMPEATMQAAVVAARAHDCDIVVDATVPFHGQTPGKTAARVARAAAATGAAAVLVPTTEIGVVVGVEPGLVVIADVRDSDRDGGADASGRGAAALLLAAP